MIISTLKTKKRSKAIVAFVVVVVIAAGSLGILLHREPENLNSVTNIENRVSKHFMLPTDEKPALATVTDTNKVSSALRKRVKNGDKILIYQKNQIAVVYRPAIDRIIDVQPVVIDNPRTQ